MNFRTYRFYVQADLFRYSGAVTFSSFLRHFFLTPGFKYTFIMRTARFLRDLGPLAFPVFILTRSLLWHYQFRYGISIPYDTDIGYGLYIGHFGGIVVNYRARIGNNCNLNQGVCIGITYGGKFPGVPVIQNKVYLAPGSIVMGGITVGDNVAVGANCVIGKPVPDNAVVVGVPGEVVSLNGSGNYIANVLGSEDCNGEKQEDLLKTTSQ
jgi:serine O-acetyltransferase